MILLSGWFNDGWDNESMSSYSNNKEYFHEVYPYWYNLGDSETSSIANGQIFERDVMDLSKVNCIKTDGKLCIPCLGNVNRNQLNILFSSQTNISNLIKSIISLMKQYSYDGINLNFERGSSTLKSSFTWFLSNLYPQMKQLNKRLVVTLPAPSSATYEAKLYYDLKSIRDLADSFIFMLYDHLYDVRVDIPTPICPIDWYEIVLKYILTKVDVAKIIIGLHNYGYKWSRTSTQGDFFFSRWTPYQTFKEEFSKSLIVDQMWDSSSKESLFVYYINGTQSYAFIATIRSIRERIQLALKYNLTKFSFWVLGREEFDLYKNIISDL